MSLNPRGRVRPAAIVLLTLAATAASWAAAHIGLPPAPHDLWSSWSLSPPLLVSLALVSFAYGHGFRRSRRSAGTTPAAVKRWQAACFGGAVAVLAVALVSPLDALGSSLLSAHMSQHLLLLVLAPALLVLSAPGYTLAWALPRKARRGLALTLNGTAPLRLARSLWETLATPLGAIFVSTVVVWLWHAPNLYQAALASEAVHVLEHSSFLACGFLFWHVLLAPLGRQRVAGGAATALLFGASVQGSALGALMAFSPAPWYGAYSGTTAAWGLTPLQDQQLAGVLMWMPLGAIYVLLACVLLWSWLREPAVDTPSTKAPKRAPAGAHSNSGLISFSTIVALIGLLLMALVIGYVFKRSASGGIPTAPITTAPGGDAANGPGLLRQYGCVTCHQIDGVRGADGKVGPPLSHIAQRAVIAGRLENDPANLIHWIRFPQEVAPGSAMPDLGVSEPHARDIAAYLYSLR